MKHSQLRRILIALVAVALALTVSSCGSDKGSGGPKVAVVGQQFTEADIFTQLYKALLEKAGYDVTVKNLGARDAYLSQLEKDKVQVSADYLASMANALSHQAGGKDVATPDKDATLAAFNKVAQPLGVTALEPAEAQDANAFAVTKKFADQHHLKTLSDLGASGLKVDVGGAPECKDRQDCLKGLESVYGIKVGKFSGTGFGSQQTKDDLTKGTTQVGVVGTSDATLDKLGLVLLDDDKNIRSADNLVPVVNSAWLAKNPKAAAALNALAPVLTTADLVQMNAAVDIGRAKASDVARQFLKSKGLI